MVTATQSTTTTTTKRSLLIQCQIRNMLDRTTDISHDRLAKLVDTGIANRWLRAVKVHGFDQSNRCHAGIELDIDWLKHKIELAVWDDEITINKTIYTDGCAPEVRNAIEVFNQAVNAECLRTKCRASYAKGVDVEMVKRELGFQDAPPIIWAGKVFKQTFGISEQPELQVILMVAESDELEPVASQTPSGKSDSLWKRIISSYA
jgi:hypothetical protein